MSVKHSLKACYATLEGDWSAFSATEIDVDRMVRAAMAHDLLGKFVEGGKRSHDLAHSLWRDCYSVFIQRKADNTEWELIPEIAEEAAACVKACTSGKLNRADTLTQVKAIQVRLAAIQRERSEAEAKVKREADDKAKQAFLDSKRASDEAARALVEAEKSKISANVEAARKELLEKQQEELRKNAEAIAAENARIKADSEAKRKAEIEARALQTAREKEAQRIARETQRNGKATSGPIESAQPGLRGMAKAGTAKDVAGMMVELLTECESPITTFENFIALAKVCGKLHKSQVKAIEAYMASIEADEKAMEVAAA
jgi:hypothetical protein